MAADFWLYSFNIFLEKYYLLNNYSTGYLVYV